jgi:hypothetical protein
VSELPLLDPHQAENELSRRAFITGAAAIGAYTALPEAVRSAAEYAGHAYDTLTSPENLVDGPIAVVEPRHDNSPAVDAQEHGKVFHVDSRLRPGDKFSVFGFNAEGLRAEHTGTPVAENSLTSAGTTIITTAEGLEYGAQEYCALFKGEDQTLAVGLSGGMYIYEPQLGREGISSGEWVRIVNDEGLYKPASHAITSSPWLTGDTIPPHDMLVQDIVQGTRTLEALGYRPYAAVLPDTPTPSNTHKTLDRHNTSQSAEELLASYDNHEKLYFVSKRGDLIDSTHLRAKAGETLDLFVQLKYQQIAGEANPCAKVRYAANTASVFEFELNPEAIEPENITDATFAVMTAESVLMEGIAQRYGTEKISGAIDKVIPSGLSPEDFFTNSLGAAGMLELIRELGLASKIEEPLRMIYEKYRDKSSVDVLLEINEAMAQIREQLALQVVSDTIASLGVRALDRPTRIDMPRAVHNLVPTKVSAKDAATPTVIDLEKAGIRTNNPNVRVRTTHLPAMQSNIEHALHKLGLK